jgi:hypothetical protein
MRVDWVIAVVTFVVFVGWSFSYYSLYSAGRTVPMYQAALADGEKVVDYMLVSASSTPTVFSSPGDMENVTVWAYMNWTEGEGNSTRVVTGRLSAQSLPCMISGDRLYWNDNVSSGDNYYFIEQAWLDTSLNCDAQLPQTDDNQTALWAAEGLRLFSHTRNLQLCSQLNGSYASLKAGMGAAFDFNVLIESGGARYSCGPKAPRAGMEVFTFPAEGRNWEGGGVNVTVRLWR